ncbi:dimethylarginine dimethylaminohydrolase family protein [Chitinophaga sp. Cy-1792]|uniref:dimethylarginine dimethylaminohydrolase family protein n=1 Tax=Chitinophaga sp. Cy-1792 TaxID=2608339 RepID=UPI00142295EA|nr:arginine deiminase family protein [Chitinophaga sp. Cy-1792]NIG55785.1 amidinotransferase [Chitinophaga sp. Cy-1792]
MIYVENEYATLKRVVLAASEFGYARKVREDDLRFLPPASVSDVEAHIGMDFSEAHPEKQRRWEQERLDLRQVLEKYGVEVLHPRKLTAAEKQAAGDDGYANFFVRDPFFTIGNCVIEGSMRFLHRRHEVLPVRNIMNTEVLPADCTYVATPQPAIAAPDDTTLGEGPFLEGGDVIVLGDTILVGNSGLASNAAGAAWLKKFMGKYGYKVEMVRLSPNILHLDCALGLIRNGLMVVCEEAFIDGLPAYFKDWQKIRVTMEHATMLATNGLPVSPEVYITDPAFSFIGEQVAAFGIKVEYIEFSISRSFGGSFRCSTQPLLRKG